MASLIYNLETCKCQASDVKRSKLTDFPCTFYTGTIKHNLPNGKFATGIINSKNGSRFEGIWQNGVFNIDLCAIIKYVYI
jgi:hypothetical protein